MLLLLLLLVDMPGDGVVGVLSMRPLTRLTVMLAAPPAAFEVASLAAEFDGSR